jgi:hypothetical protein
MIELIPKRCLSILPFTAESLRTWSDASDVLSYLTTLFDKEAVLIDQKGKRVPINLSSYASTLYQDGRKRFGTLAKEFHTYGRKAKPVPAAEDQMEKIPDFDNDEHFGLVAKYSIAWSGTVDEVLSESAFFSIAHVLESESELDCSVLLASHLYYKQALQVIRNFLEGVVAELFFCDNPHAFRSWKANSYRLPFFRGKDGMLEDLANRGFLSRELVARGAKLYGELNGSIHGAESRLIHAGLFNGTHTGRIFKYQSFVIWADYFVRGVAFAIPILKTTVDLWQKASAAVEGIQCIICHQVNDFEIAEKGSYAGRESSTQESSTLECRQCGNRMTFDSRFLRQRGLG